MDVSQKAKEVVKSGRLIGLPTETVYGLAAPSDNLELVKKIFAVKKRPAFDPLIVHVSSVTMAKNLVVDFPPEAEQLAKKFWPGPLTIVLPKLTIVSDLITAGQSTVAIRCPNHPMALEIINGVNKPLVAPSANPYQKLSPVFASQVKEYFSDGDVYVFDGGECSVGIESTIVGLDAASARFSILRKGIITSNEIGEVLTGFKEVPKDKYLPSDFHVPGGDDKHYRPAVPLIVDNANTTDTEIRTKLNLNSDLKVAEVNLNSDPFLAARTLYKELYLAGKSGCSVIVLRLPSYGASDASIWEAIIDRIKRAATHFF